MKTKSFLVTIYSEKDVVLGNDENEFTLTDSILNTLDELNPNAGVFDVAVDTKLNRILKVAIKNERRK